MTRSPRLAALSFVIVVAFATRAMSQERYSAQALTPNPYMPAPPAGDVSPAQALLQPQTSAPVQELNAADDRPEKWNVYGGSVLLHRSAPAPGALVTTIFLPGAPTILDASNLNLGWMWGFDAGATYNFNDRWGMDIKYLQVQPWTATFGPVTVPTSNVANQGLPSFVFLPNAVSAQYLSTLRSAEINGRYAPLSWLTALAGFRYVNIDEMAKLTQNVVGAPITATNLDLTSNHLFGGQIGLDALLINSGRLTIDTYAKAGIFGAYIRTLDGFELVAFGVPAPGTPFFVRTANRGQVSFFGDGGLNATYRFNSWVSVEGGYQLMWISGAALAGDQFRAGPGPIAAPLAVNSTGFAFYQGFTLGLTISH
jgi:hypothetical protein